MNELMDKVFFNPGDLVTVRQDVEFKPKMIVKSIDKSKSSTDPKPQLFGVTCFWFTSDGLYQSHRFNTKDLEHCD